MTTANNTSMPETVRVLMVNSDGVVIISNAPAATTYIRADLVDAKPADDEVREAIEELTSATYQGEDDFMNGCVLSTDGTHVIISKETVQTLIRAATKKQTDIVDAYVMEFLEWLSAPHDIDLSTKQRSDYWARQFIFSCARSRALLENRKGCIK